MAGTTATHARKRCANANQRRGTCMRKISSGLDEMVQRFIEGEVRGIRSGPNRFKAAESQQPEDQTEKRAA